MWLNVYTDNQVEKSTIPGPGRRAGLLSCTGQSGAADLYYADDSPAWKVESYKQLALGVFEQAIHDSRMPGRLGVDARDWLSADGLVWADLLGLGLQPGKYSTWLVGLSSRDTL